jgi:hypothetical protein
MGKKDGRSCPGCGYLWEEGDIVENSGTCQECLDRELMEMINWLDNAPFLMGKLTEKDKATREKIIAIITRGTR